MRPLARLWPLAALGGSLLLAAALPGRLASAPDDRPDALGMRLGALRLQSAGGLTFAPDGILFLADGRAGTLHALALPDSGPATFEGRALAEDLDAKVAALLGTTRDRVRFADMARHPKSGALYLSVSRESDAGPAPALVRVGGADAVTLVSLERVRHSSTPVPSVPAKDAKTPWGQPQWALAITDLAFADGELWVAGLSNEQFASALRRVPFPFPADAKAASGAKVTTVEIYHTSHDKWETAAPIDAFLPVTIGGTPMLLAGYGCSPIATFRRADFTEGKHLRGRTVAELGGGNRPTDMLAYESKGKQWILVANSHRTLMRIDPEELARAPEMKTPVKQAYQPAGVGYLPVASAGVMAIEDLSPESIAVLERDIETGAVHLMALQKRWL